MARQRSDKIVIQESDEKAVHKWLVVEAGYFDVLDTPEGLFKIPRSISFKSMDQNEFNHFYKSVFNVAWRHVLSAEFKDEAEAETAINLLQSMG